MLGYATYSLANAMNLLPASSPAAQGVLAERVAEFLDGLESAPEVEPHSLVVLRHGYAVAAGWWWPYTADRPHLVYSLGKIFTATATGLAIEEGLVGLDDPVVSYFPELASRVTDLRARSMRVRHLASMATGHTEDTAGRVFGQGEEDPVLNFLLLPPEHEPGSVFAYNQAATYTLAAIVQRATGERLVHYLRRCLFDRLGATALSWLQAPPGRDIGYSGLYATTETVALLGQLYLRGGKWQGEQLLAPSWTTAATHPQVPTHVGDAGGDGALGFGYQFWMSRHGYRGDGAYGQYCLVLPDEDAVVAMTAQTRSAGRPDMQTVLAMVWEKLLPSFAAGSVADSGADEALQARLGGLCLLAAGGRASPPGDGAGWAGSTFLPAGGSCRAQPSLRAVGVLGGGQAWRVALYEDGSELQGVFIGDGWSVTEGASSAGATVPVACSGGWTSAAALRVDVIFLETPHRLSVTCKLPERTFDARWHSRPAHASFLRDLHAPSP